MIGKFLDMLPQLYLWAIIIWQGVRKIMGKPVENSDLMTVLLALALYLWVRDL